MGALASVQLFDPLTGFVVGMGQVGSTGFGSAVSWFPGSQRRFAVGNVVAREVRIYDLPPGSPPALVSTIPNTLATGFGKALAVGDFRPASPGPELAIGAEGAVFIYSESGVLLGRVLGMGASFGTALAVEHWRADLDVLWVGEPGLDQVWRFIGSEGVVADALGSPGASFGASLAIDSANTVAIGAPGYGAASGAVYFDARGFSAMQGEVRACTGLTCVSSNCLLGTCTGGVFCNTGGSPELCLPVVEVCDNAGHCLQEDGGISDAGSVAVLDGGPSPDPDAGMTPVDGGAPDAGAQTDAGSSSSDAGDRPREDGGSLNDGGTADAGEVALRDDVPLTFKTTGCGCTETSALPLLLLALALGRRTRHFPLRGRGIA